MALAAEKIIIPSMDAMRLHGHPGIAGSDKVFLANNLDDALTILQGGKSQFSLDSRTVDNHRETSNTHSDLGCIVGNETAKRGLLIAAAGGHHIACIGLAGKKTQYLADCLRQILPPLTEQQYIETEKIYDAAGVDNGDCNTVRPLQVPYCSSSVATIIGGGGGAIKPGAASLAHNGVLLLKEFEEFPRPVREALSYVLQEKEITISRLRDKVVFPADFQLMLS